MYVCMYMYLQRGPDIEERSGSGSGSGSGSVTRGRAVRVRLFCSIVGFGIEYL